jgi:MFS family permease
MRRSIFYGWVIVAGIAFVSFVIGGMGGLNAGLFVKPMEHDIGIRQSTFGWAQSARLLTFAASGWVIGRLLDKGGVQLLLAAAGATLGVSIAGLALANNGWQVVALFALSGATGLQGGGNSLFTQVPLARWFVRNRGKALSMAFIGTPAGIFVFPTLTQLLIDEFGWRSAWAIIGSFGGIVVVIVALLIMRDRPSDMGLAPDGIDEAPPEPGTLRPAYAAEYSWTKEQAVRSSTFWRLAAVDGLRMTAWGTLGFFRVAFFIDQGIDKHVVALALSSVALSALPASLLSGYIVDRFQPRYVSFAATAVMCMSFVFTMLADSAPFVFAALFCDGVGVATFLVSQGVIWPHYFGAANIGRIRGTALLFGLGLSAIAGPATGIVHDQTGSYTEAWTVATVLLAIVALIILFTPRPAPPPAPDESMLKAIAI